MQRFSLDQTSLKSQPVSLGGISKKSVAQPSNFHGIALVAGLHGFRRG